MTLIKFQLVRGSVNTSSSVLLDVRALHQINNLKKSLVDKDSLWWVLPGGYQFHATGYSSDFLENFSIALVSDSETIPSIYVLIL